MPSKLPEESDQATPLPGEASTSELTIDQLEFTPIQEIREKEIVKVNIDPYSVLTPIVWLYIQVKQLGSGGSGCVYLAKWHGVDVAMKEFYHNDPHEKDRALHQVSHCLDRAYHPMSLL